MSLSAVKRALSKYIQENKENILSFVPNTKVYAKLVEWKSANRPLPGQSLVTTQQRGQEAYLTAFGQEYDRMSKVLRRPFHDHQELIKEHVLEAPKECTAFFFTTDFLTVHVKQLLPVFQGILPLTCRLFIGVFFCHGKLKRVDAVILGGKDACQPLVTPPPLPVSSSPGPVQGSMSSVKTKATLAKQKAYLKRRLKKYGA